MADTGVVTRQLEIAGYEDIVFEQIDAKDPTLVVIQDERGRWNVQDVAELLGRALENVIRNSIKYTAPGTTVVLSARREDDHSLHLRVSDAGPGVPEEELEAIFTPFHRGSIDTQQRGYGLGLAIARRAIQAHGGSIQASNRPEGGLQVDIRLPLLAKDT